MSDLDHSVTSSHRAQGLGGPIIGLTGGIAMGKTALSDYLHQAYQLPVLDADLYARAAVAPGTAGLDAIFQRYGTGLRRPDGSLDRRQLGAIVFANSAERHWLEQQIHPYVRQQMQADAQQHRTSDPHIPIVFVIPLLFEADLTHWVSEIWVVYCPQIQQLQRLMARESLTEAEARLRIAAQIPIGQKCDRADVVLINEGTVAALEEGADRALTQRFPKLLRLP
jgi:dephospho-CoA kinase